MKKVTLTNMKILSVLFASVGMANAKTREEFCVVLTGPAYYYFDAKAHGGVPEELLARWLLRASSSYDVNLSGDSRGLISDLGAEVESGAKTRLEAMEELFSRCVEKYRNQ
jgi:hypothetical protein